MREAVHIFYEKATVLNRSDWNTDIFSCPQGILHQSPTDMQGELYTWLFLIIMPLPQRRTYWQDSLEVLEKWCDSLPALSCTQSNLILLVHLELLSKELSREMAQWIRTLGVQAWPSDFMTQLQIDMWQHMPVASVLNCRELGRCKLATSQPSQKHCKLQI